MKQLRGLRYKMLRSGTGKLRYTVELTTDNKSWTRATQDGLPVILASRKDALTFMIGVLQSCRV